MKKEFEEILKNSFKGDLHNFATGHLKNELCFTYAETLEAMQKAYEMGQPKWIPISESLPNEMQDVSLFDATYRKVHQGYYWGYDKDYEKYRFYSRDFVITGDVTHWQPLPESPNK